LVGFVKVNAQADAQAHGDDGNTEAVSHEVMRVTRGTAAASSNTSGKPEISTGHLHKANQI
jgi:hypothetical protein